MPYRRELTDTERAELERLNAECIRLDKRSALADRRAEERATEAQAARKRLDRTAAIMMHEGASSASIGRVLGVTRQAVRDRLLRFTDRLAPPRPDRRAS